MADPIRMRPIVDDDGKPLIVYDSDTITGKHVNAMTRFTREHHAAFTREHGVDGVHKSLMVPRCSILAGTFGAGLVDGRSRLMGRTLRDHPGLITITRLALGTARFTLAIPLPDMNYALMSSTAGRVGGDYFRHIQLRITSKLSTTQFEVQSVIAGGGPIDAEISFEIYG